MADELDRRRFAFGAAGCGVLAAAALAGGRWRPPGRRPPAIIDTHTHYWDTRRRTPPGRRSAVPFASPARPILPDEFRRAAAAAGVTGAIAVEASGWLEDNAWLLAQARSNPIVVGVIGNLVEVMGTSGFRPALARFAADRLFRGVRVHPDQLAAGAFAGDLAALSDRGLVCEVNANGPSELRVVAEQARRFPDLRLVLDHAGYVPFAGPPDPEWRVALASAAQRPNVICKVSRFQEQAAVRPGGAAPVDVGSYRTTLDVLCGLFGEDRLMFGSNWPLSTSAGSLQDGVRTMAAYFEARGEDCCHKFFAGNARHVYGAAAPGQG